jgi:hypothetical protein
MSSRFMYTEVLYDNPLASSSDLKGFRMEGPGTASFPLGRMRLESTRNSSEGQAANFVYWCSDEFPPDISVSWDFWPIREPGLCMMFFSASGRRGEDIFDPRLAPRTGVYGDYHSADINAYHVSYYRRRWESERAFQVCNLRKSHGFHLVAQGADPLPSVLDARPPYRMELIHCAGHIEFSINDVTAFRWTDDGTIGGPPLHGGRIGFRQMAPLIGEYGTMRVQRVEWNGT